MTIGRNFLAKNINLVDKSLFYTCLAVLCIAIYRSFMLRWQYVLLVPNAVKDEVGFVDDFRYFLSNGWYASVASGTSPLFNLAGRFIYVFTGNMLLSLKLVNFLSLVLMVVVWSRFLYKDLKIKGELFLITFLFLINAGLVRSAYFSGCDDPLFVLFISLGFIYLYRSIYNAASPQLHLFFAGVFCAFALGVRPLFIYYSLGFIALLFLFYKINKSNRKYLTVFILSFMFTVLLIQYPSFKEKGSVSIHNKDFKNKDVTWAEINYLFLLRNKQNLLFGRNNNLKPSPEDVIAYNNENIQAPLPKTYKESIFKNPTITLKNFVGLFYLQALPFVRQLGLIYLVFVFAVITTLKSEVFFKSKIQSAFLFYLFFTLLICITPVVHLEFRWFMVFPFLITVFACEELHSLSKRNVIFKFVFYINTSFVGILNIMHLGIW